MFVYLELFIFYVLWFDIEIYVECTFKYEYIYRTSIILHSYFIIIEH